MKNTNHEFCSMTCTINELENEIKRTGSTKRAEFLRGVLHARLIIRTGTNGEIK